MFVRNIRRFRLEKNFSQKELAIKSGISQMEVSYLERNKRSPTLYTLKKISDALGICVYELFYTDCELYPLCEKCERKYLGCTNKNSK